jgi:hypothetical protein
MNFHCHVQPGDSHVRVRAMRLRRPLLRQPSGACRRPAA